MRRTLSPSLLGGVSRNVKKGNTAGRIFELARTYIPKNLPVDDFPTERKHLCVAVFGENEDFFTLKGVLAEIEDNFRVKFNLGVRAEKTYLHPGVSAKILLNGKEIGVYGQVTYETCAKFDLECKVYVLELDYDELSAEFTTPFRFEPLPKFPDVKRDLALVADEKITCGEIEDVIRSACKLNVKSVELFDVYAGAQLGEGKKSMAFTVTFCSDGVKPLETEDVDGFVKRILGSLKHRLNVELR